MDKEMEFYVKTNDGCGYGHDDLTVYVDTKDLVEKNNMEDFLRDIKRAYREKHGNESVDFIYIGLSDEELDNLVKKGRIKFSTSGYETRPGYEYANFHLDYDDIKEIESME